MACTHALRDGWLGSAVELVPHPPSPSQNGIIGGHPSVAAVLVQCDLTTRHGGIKRLGAPLVLA